MVVSHIFRRYFTPARAQIGKRLLFNPLVHSISLSSSIAHLRYLYSHPKALPVEPLPPRVWLFNQDKRKVSRVGFKDLYFESDEEYGIKELSKRISNPSNSETLSAPGIFVNFINPGYLDAVHLSSDSENEGWKLWLHKFVGVRRYPRLEDRHGILQLSPFFKYIVEHRPDRLIGTLKTHWSFYQERIDGDIARELSTGKVPCQSGELVMLKDAYIPLPYLKSTSERFLDGTGRALAYIQVPAEFDAKAPQEWMFLETFKVGSKCDLRFYLDVLGQLIPGSRENDGKGDGMMKIGPSRVLELYEEIEKHCHPLDENAESVRWNIPHIAYLSIANLHVIDFSSKTGHQSLFYPMDNAGPSG
jgi:hypothetical protein